MNTEQLEAEMTEMTKVRVTIDITAADAARLVSLVQLAARHPGVREPALLFGRQFVYVMRTTIASMDKFPLAVEAMSQEGW